MTRISLVIAAFSTGISTMVFAQTSQQSQPPVQAALPAPAVQSAKKTAANVKSDPALATKTAAAAPTGKPGTRCFRLPLSDVAFGTEAAIASARVKLAEYAAVQAKTRGWPASPLTKSAETTSCELYLDFGPLIEKEYRCLVTATFCQK